jgi:hypothetical protein
MLATHWENDHAEKAYQSVDRRNARPLGREDLMARSKGIFKLRRRFGHWYIDLTTEAHELIKTLGPMPWADTASEAEKCEKQGYRKEQ